ncbi:MAG TPA: ankyrin repeat domain-containing protein [Candidatus Solibacter sp.]|nr:ankyrin repeat domain-containing protein [Candidatus Solibacter sp.]
MYPNPQAALPLPPRPSVEQYRKLAKDLVKACRTGDPGAISAWASRWKNADEIAGFAQEKLASGCALTAAQFVIARAYGFLSWPKFVKHIEELARTSSSISAYERAADAIVAGDIPTLQRLLREHPDLVRAQSTREHRATLLHYVSANGVEGYRQVSPKNAAEIAELLIASGAEVDATAEVYHGDCTTLGLVATSEPPHRAGVQIAVIDVLLAHGARMEELGIAGRDTGLIRACIANGQPEAAEYLVSRGAPFDLQGAAGVGRLDDVKRLVEGADEKQMKYAFASAAGYGRTAVVEYFLDRGMPVDIVMNAHGEGSTALHMASYNAHSGTIKLLLSRGASVHIIDKTWHTPPLIWALTGWMHKGGERYYEAVALLVAAGSKVTPDLLEWDKARADPKMMAALKHT